MLYLRKIKFSKNELDKLKNEYGGYLWTASDGTHHAHHLFRQEPEVQAQLQVIRSEYAQMKPEDILCAGLDLETGEIFYPVLINRRNPFVNKDGVPDVFRERVDTLMRYFFEYIPNYQEERNRPRYSSKPTPLSFN